MPPARLSGVNLPQINKKTPLFTTFFYLVSSVGLLFYFDAFVSFCIVCLGRITLIPEVLSTGEVGCLSPVYGNMRQKQARGGCGL